MATLVSPGVSVTVVDDSFFVAASAPTVPLIFIATADEKTQVDGITPAAGTYESNVIRNITSASQSTQLYGVPRFLSDTSGAAQYGDCRNEVGLLALNKFLGIGSSAYVVRANIDLNDDTDTICARWETKMQAASYVLSSYVTSYIAEFNAANNYIPSNPSYKLTVTASELETLATEATSDLFALTTFKNAYNDFYNDETTPTTTTAGFQVVNFGGSITAGSNPTALVSATTYTAAILIDSVPFALSITGSQATTFTALVTALQALIGAAGTIAISNGNLQFTSATVGTSSTVLITDTNLFSSLNGYVSLLLPTNGVLADAPLLVYANGYASASTGSYLGFNGMATEWVASGSGGTVPSGWTAAEAADMLIDAADDFQYTVEFENETSLGANDAARRVSIVTALNAVITSNTAIRSENYEYNLILCPGFYETTANLVSLSVDIMNEAFVIADVPPTLSPEDAATWGLTSARTVDTYVAYYYPGGTTTNVDGTTVYGSASGIALSTYTFSDNTNNNVYLAPAGPTRGVVTGYTMGYITGTLGTATTFNATDLNLGERNALYQYFTNINPITEIPGRGVLVMGQKTSQGTSSAMDRVNVVRTVAYLRRALRKAAFAYLFEPNDQITRDNLKSAADAIMADILSKRGLYDYLSVCDTSNNDTTAIDNSELYLDIAIKPMKAVEFIYIPIRVVDIADSLTTS